MPRGTNSTPNHRAGIEQSLCLACAQVVAAGSGRVDEKSGEVVKPNVQVCVRMPCVVYFSAEARTRGFRRLQTRVSGIHCLLSMVQVGSTVLYSKFSGTEFSSDDDKQFIVVRESDIIAQLS